MPIEQCVFVMMPRPVLKNKINSFPKAEFRSSSVEYFRANRFVVFFFSEVALGLFQYLPDKVVTLCLRRMPGAQKKETRAVETYFDMPVSFSCKKACFNNQRLVVDLVTLTLCVNYVVL
jgi:hypothetical protein